MEEKLPLSKLILRVAERLAKERPSGDSELALARIHELLAARQYAKDRGEKNDEAIE